MSFFIFILGLAIGSFLNVCIYRIPLKKSIINIPSYCPACGTNIGWLHKIPVISFMFLKGKCCHCKNNISWQYPIVELLTAIIFLFLFLKLEFSNALIHYFLLICLLIVISFIDAKIKIIPNSIQICGLVIAIISIIFLRIIPFYDSIAGGILGGGVLYLIALIGQLLYKKQSMGGGDIKLIAIIGLLIGWMGIVFVLCITFISSALWSIAGIILGKLQRNSIIPFAPFIAFGSVVYIIWILL